MIVVGNVSYYEDLSQAMPIPANFFRDVANLFQRDLRKRDKLANFQIFLESCSDLTVRYEIALDTGLTRYAESLLLQYSYLRDLVSKRDKGPKREMF